MVASLERNGRVRVVAAAASSEEAASLTRLVRPEVVLLQLPISAGLVVARAVFRADSAAKLVVFGVAEDEREILGWAEAGVLGCVVRDGSLDELIDTLEQAARGEASCSPSVAGVLFRRVAALRGSRTLSTSTGPNLTSREVEILQLLAQGLSNKQIAETLALQVPTVKNHVHHILSKLGLRHRAEASAWAGPQGDSE